MRLNLSASSDGVLNEYWTEHLFSSERPTFFLELYNLCKYFLPILRSAKE